jgi:hypothetical protein
MRVRDFAVLVLMSSTALASNDPGVPLTPIAISANQAEPAGPAVDAVDGDMNTQWTGNGVGAYLTLDWGVAKTVRQLRISFYNGNARQYDFQVLSSQDGHSYAFAGAFQSSGTTSTFEGFDVLANGRYLRILGLGNNVNLYNAYNEVQAYGDGAKDRKRRHPLVIGDSPS